MAFITYFAAGLSAPSIVSVWLKANPLIVSTALVIATPASSKLSDRGVTLIVGNGLLWLVTAVRALMPKAPSHLTGYALGLFGTMGCHIWVFGYVTSHAVPRHPPELQKAVQTVFKLKEAKDLLVKVQTKHGPLTIVVAPPLTDLSQPNPFEAFYDCYMHTIHIREPEKFSLEKQMHCLMFELHNASLRDRFIRMDQFIREGNAIRAADRDPTSIQLDEKTLALAHDYATQMEHSEHISARGTNRFWDLGISRGIFPPCPYRYLENWEEALRMAKQSGHYDAYVAAALAHAYGTPYHSPGVTKLPDLFPVDHFSSDA